MALDEYDETSFPEFLYLDAFADVRQAVASGALRNGWEHFTRYGREEIETGRRPSPFAGGRLDMLRSVLPPPDENPVPMAPDLVMHTASAAGIPYTPPPAPALDYPSEDDLFDEELYFALNPDLPSGLAAGKFKTGLAHWHATGAAETERGQRPAIVQDSLYAGPQDLPQPPPPDMDRFDAETYFLLYPDVLQALGGNPDAARHHWLQHGRLEGRTGPGIAPYRGMRVTPHAVLAKPFGINLFGPFAAISGLGTAARGLLRALRCVGVPIDIHVFDVSRGAPRITAEERARPARYRINLMLANADQMARLVALYPPGHFDDAYNIAVWAWELAAFRADWFTAFGPVDEIWTNSEFEMRSIGAVSPVPLTRIPLVVELPFADGAAARRSFGIPQDRFVFMVAFDVGSTSARKNPRLVVEAFREAFAADDNVFLVVKFHSVAVEPAITRQLTQALRGADNVLLLSDQLSDRDMGQLRAACD